MTLSVYYKTYERAHNIVKIESYIRIISKSITFLRKETFNLNFAPKS